MDDQQPNRRFQFTLRKLLLWTGVWAICLGIVRATGIPWPVAAAVIGYLALLLAIRVRWGSGRGAMIVFFMWPVAAASLGTIYLVIEVVAGDPFEGMAGLVGAVALACTAGSLIGFYSFLFVSGVLSVVEWLDGLMQRHVAEPTNGQTDAATAPDLEAEPTPPRNQSGGS